MRQVYNSAIFTPGGSPLISNLVIENCDLGFNQHTSFVGGFNPMIALGNVQDAQILNNYVHDAASQGIALYAYNAGDSIDGSVISGNVVLRAVQSMSDGGAIYIDMHKTNVHGGRVTIANNFIRDYGASGVQAEGIYLDDDTSNTTVSGNIIGPAAVGAVSPIATVINGGCCNTFSDNIVDLGTAGTEWIAGWSAPGGGGAILFNWTNPNVFKSNVIISNYVGPTRTSRNGVRGHEYIQGPGYPSNMGVIADNAYFNYGGGAVTTTGNIVSDSNPTTVDPQLSGWAYALAANSTVFTSINFAPIIGGWGPPGFVIAPAGARPSNPH